MTESRFISGSRATCDVIVIYRDRATSQSECQVQFGPCSAVPSGSAVKNLPADAGRTGSIPGSGRSPGGGNGNPLHSCLEGCSPWGRRVGHNLAAERRHFACPRSIK